jgi:hypothetical protein
VTPDLRGWLPYSVDVGPDDPELRWCHLAGDRLTSPFFEQDVGDALRRPFNQLFDVRTPMTAAAAHLAAHRPLDPTAFIFHTGRCGSTLVAQLLATDPANRVVSEPAPLDAVLRAPLRRAVAPERHLDWIRTVVGALGQPSPGERRLFVKLDSWSIAGAVELDAAFPGVPWLFVVRDPVEVLVSQLRSPSMTMLIGAVPAELFGVSSAEAVTWSPVRYAAHIQAALLRRMTELVDRAHVIDHAELPAAVGPWLVELGIEVDDAAAAAMRERSTRHGKSGGAYHDDRAEKQAVADDEVRAAVAVAAGPAHRALLASRTRPAVPPA